MSFFDRFKSQAPPATSVEMQIKRDYPDLFNTSTSSFSDSIDQSDTIMPYYWSSEDTKRSIIFSLAPVGAVLAGSAALCQDNKYKLFLDTTRAPHWAPHDRKFYSALDVVTSLPLGYASYLVYKHGGGFDYTDTTVALGLYVTNLVAAIATIPLLKQRNLKGLACNSIFVHATALATAFAFWKIDKNAGYWLLPYAAWTGFYALLAYSTNQLNKKFD
ncbi:hypothetical protein M3Y97_00479700 [Aphelenchoides bicaudatus]|nr:hypothetical protein M3Y97_00479700 [Aphelenchoides bicaudatus]